MVPQRVTGPARAIAASPRHDQLAILTEAGVVVLWDAIGGQVREQGLSYPRFEGPVTLSFDPSGTRVIVASQRTRQGRGVTVWDLRTDRWRSHTVDTRFRPHLLAAHAGGLVAVEWPGDEQPPPPTLVRRGWDLAVEGASVLAEAPRAISVSGDGAFVALLGAAGVSVVDAEGATRSRHEGDYAAIAFRPGGQLLAAVTTDGALHLLRPDDGAVLAEVELGVPDVRWSPDGAWLVGVTRDTWGPVVDGRTATVRLDERRAHDGGIALGAGAVWAHTGDGEMLRWSPDRPEIRFSLGSQEVTALVAGRTALGALRGRLGVVSGNGRGGATLAFGEGPLLAGGLRWGDGHRLLVVDEQGLTLYARTGVQRSPCPMGRIFAWDGYWGAGAPVVVRDRRACRPGEPTVQDTLAVSRDGSTLVAVRDGGLVVLRGEEEPVALRLDRDETVQCAARCDAEVELSHDGAVALVTRPERAPRVFDARTGRGQALRIEPAEADSPYLAPDGRTALFRGRTQLHLVDLRRRRVVYSHDGTRTAQTFSPDGALLALSPRDAPVILIDAHRGRVRVEIPRPEGLVGATRFSDDGARVILTGVQNDRRFVFDAGTGAAIGEEERRSDLGILTSWPLDGTPFTCDAGRAYLLPTEGERVDLGPCEPDSSPRTVEDGWLAVGLGDRLSVVPVDAPARAVHLRLYSGGPGVAYSAGRALGNPAAIAETDFRWRAAGSILTAPLGAASTAPTGPVTAVPWIAGD